MAPIKVRLAETMDMDLFFINQLAKFSKVGAAPIFGDSACLGHMQAIDVVGEHATCEWIVNGLTDGTPPAIIIALGRVAEKCLEVFGAAFVIPSTGIAGRFVAGVDCEFPEGTTSTLPNEWRSMRMSGGRRGGGLRGFQSWGSGLECGGMKNRIDPVQNCCLGGLICA